MTRAAGARRAVWLAAACVAVAAAGGPPPATANGAAALVEREFASAIRTVTPATVYIVAKPELGASPGSSGVLVSRNGYVLSDKDAGGHWRPRIGPDGKPLKAANGQPAMEFTHADDVEVRVPDLKRGTYAVHSAKVVRRIAEIDSTLLKIQAPSGVSFPFVTPRDSDVLDVGQFTFAMGTAFGQNDGGSAALTGGVVAALVPRAPGADGGKWAEVYTSAAVNPGVNGGPLVDVDGGLVGVISTWGDPTDLKNPFQFLGKAYPINRMRHAYRDLPDAAAVFPPLKSLTPRSKQAELLERAFSAAAAHVWPSVVSIEATRDKPFEMRVLAPGQPQPVALPRYQGPFSGVVVSPDGWIVTSLYNFADTVPLAYVNLPPLPNRIAATLGEVKDLKVHFPDGPTVGARIAGHDQRVGILALKADLPQGFQARPLEAAPEASYEQGRIVLCAANPFGSARPPRPLFVMGLLSRTHSDDSGAAWRGDFQTDASLTDGTVGGALVDVRGRLLGIATIRDPGGHGRNSGIGFGIAWPRVRAALPPMQTGQSVAYGNGFMGISWTQEPSGAIRITSVSKDTAAAKAGMQAGDVVLSIDGKTFAKFEDAHEYLRQKNEGDVLVFSVERGEKKEKKDVSVTLGRRPGW